MLCLALRKQLASFNLEQEATALWFPLKNTGEHNEEGVTANLADTKEINMGSVVAGALSELSGIFTFKEEKLKCFIVEKMFLLYS